MIHLQRARGFFFVVLASFLLFSEHANAQSQVLENNPSDIRWHQINTPSFRVIFPDGFESEAQKMANTLEHISAPVSKSLGGEKPRKLSIVVQNQNTISNGFVTLGPRRSEFQTTPPQDYNFLGTNNWLELLAVHEYRHVVQFNQSRTGWNKLFFYLFGQNTQAGMAFTAAPPWFWEGDATVTETVITPSGRGRIPSFDRIFRANLLEGKRYDYNKQHLRSYKDFVPDHYVLGYHMVANIRRRTGQEEIMDKVTRSAWSWPFIPFTFSNSLKKHTGEFIVPNYEIMMTDMKMNWEKQLEGLELTDFDVINKRTNNIFTDYHYPRVLDDGTVVALKSGIADIQQFVKINADGSLTNDLIPGIMNDAGMLSSAGSKIVWNEFHFDPRWRARNYSVIKMYDFKTGEQKVITEKTRYAAADISPDETQIATVLNTARNNNFLVIIDANNGTEQKRFDNSDNAQYGMPRWANDGKSIVVLKTNSQGKAVVRYDVVSGKETELVPPGHENIGHPLLYKGLLFYNSPYNGIDNIYVKNLETNEVYQVTSSKYGAYNPAISPDGQYIYYNEHTVNGLDIVRVALQEGRWKSMATVEDRNLRYYQPLVEQEQHDDLLQNIPDKEYSVKKYSKLGNMINIHSWGPFATTDLIRAQAGIFSRDVLSNTDVSLGYVYDIEEESGFASAGVSFQAWYPITDVEYQLGNRSTSSYKWDESTVLAGVRVPLVLTRSKYFRELTFSNQIGLRQVTNFQDRSRNDGRRIETRQRINDSTTVDVFFLDVNDLDNGNLVFNQFGITFSNLMKQSTRDINSRFGQFVTFQRTNTIGGDFTGAITAVRGGLFFPGLSKNHSFFLRGGYQSKKTDARLDIYSFRNAIFKPRGYSFPEENNFTTVQFNYALPLWHADLSFGPVLNIKRIKANVFYDLGWDNVIQNAFFAESFGDRRPGDFFGSADIDSNYVSYGVELTFDVNILRFIPEIELGARILNREANAWNNGGPSIELILGGVNF
ncbi:hypothetical protein FNH22_22155 [Fulvivirga sp. M361]|uniref:PD40 domain-containing protein n=1 Tax=Fulvivirga sp. M361 TaxID=2594266 RepID=UPI001179C548|nr:PD40 domain-containing protein [Fulvivirga sp. M361]TRX52415.1 hypothetical protein FNH22_22155 [Fulvivirga sp. M361]